MEKSNRSTNKYKINNIKGFKYYKQTSDQLKDYLTAIYSDSRLLNEYRLISRKFIKDKYNVSDIRYRRRNHNHPTIQNSTKKVRKIGNDLKKQVDNNINFPKLSLNFDKKTEYFKFLSIDNLNLILEFLGWGVPDFLVNTFNFHQMLLKITKIIPIGKVAYEMNSIDGSFINPVKLEELGCIKAKYINFENKYTDIRKKSDFLRNRFKLLCELKNYSYNILYSNRITIPSLLDYGYEYINVDDSKMEKVIINCIIKRLKEKKFFDIKFYQYFIKFLDMFLEILKIKVPKKKKIIFNKLFSEYRLMSKKFIKGKNNHEEVNFNLGDKLCKFLKLNPNFDIEQLNSNYSLYKKQYKPLFDNLPKIPEYYDYTYSIQRFFLWKKYFEKNHFNSTWLCFDINPQVEYLRFIRYFNTKSNKLRISRKEYIKLRVKLNKIAKIVICKDSVDFKHQLNIISNKSKKITMWRDSGFPRDGFTELFNEYKKYVSGKKDITANLYCLILENILNKDKEDLIEKFKSILKTYNYRNRYSLEDGEILL